MNNNDFLNYPISTTSITSSNDGEPINRSRTWSEDITKYWNINSNNNITGIETFNERAQRYLVYFKINHAQLKRILSKLLLEIEIGLKLHSSDPNAQWSLSKCSLKMSDTHIPSELIPNGSEKGIGFALDFGGSDATTIRAVKAELEGDGKICINDIKTSLRDECLEFPKGALDRDATASALFNCFALHMKKKLLEEENTIQEINKEAYIPIVFSLGFPINKRAVNRATLLHWTKEFETGRNTNDPVEKIDVDALLNCAFERMKVPARTIAVINDTSGVIIACAYEHPSIMFPCRVGMVIGNGINGCYIQAEPHAIYGYKGCIIDCEIGSFDKSLPINDIDLEIDFAAEATEGTQLFEKMISTTYLGELCRRLILKVWQSEAPQLAWVRYSLPWLACACIIEDSEDNHFEITENLLLGLWEWNTTIEERRAIHELFQAVFERSAALAAVALIGLAHQTGRLQPAMGGITCGITGSLYCRCPFYANSLQNYVKEILPEGITNCIKLCSVSNGVIKGATILCTIMAKNKDFF